MQDYNYIFGSCMELTLEISCEKYPNVTGLEETWIQNQDVNILSSSNINEYLFKKVFFFFF